MLSAFNQTIRELAASTGLGLIELEGAFLESSSESLNGFDLFLDYAHPKEAGHKLAAVNVMVQIAAALSLPVSPEALTRSIAQDGWLQLNDYDPTIHERLGESYRLLGDEPNARAAFERAQGR